MSHTNTTLSLNDVANSAIYIENKDALVIIENAIQNESFCNALSDKQVHNLLMSFRGERFITISRSQYLDLILNSPFLMKRIKASSLLKLFNLRKKFSYISECLLSSPLAYAKLPEAMRLSLILENVVLSEVQMHIIERALSKKDAPKNMLKLELDPSPVGKFASLFFLPHVLVSLSNEVFGSVINEAIDVLMLCAKESNLGDYLYFEHIGKLNPLLTDDQFNKFVDCYVKLTSIRKQNLADDEPGRPPHTILHSDNKSLFLTNESVCARLNDTQFNALLIRELHIMNFDSRHKKEDGYGRIYALEFKHVCERLTKEQVTIILDRFYLTDFFDSSDNPKSQSFSFALRFEHFVNLLSDEVVQNIALGSEYLYRDVLPYDHVCKKLTPATIKAVLERSKEQFLFWIPFLDSVAPLNYLSDEDKDVIITHYFLSEEKNSIKKLFNYPNVIPFLTDEHIEKLLNTCEEGYFQSIKLIIKQPEFVNRLSQKQFDDLFWFECRSVADIYADILDKPYVLNRIPSDLLFDAGGYCRWEGIEAYADRMSDTQLDFILSEFPLCAIDSESVCKRASDTQFNHALSLYPSLALEYPWVIKRMTDAQFNQLVDNYPNSATSLAVVNRMSETQMDKYLLKKSGNKLSSKSFLHTLNKLTDAQFNALYDEALHNEKMNVVFAANPGIIRNNAFTVIRKQAGVIFPLPSDETLLDWIQSGRLNEKHVLKIKGGRAV